MAARRTPITDQEESNQIEESPSLAKAIADRKAAAAAAARSTTSTTSTGAPVTSNSVDGAPSGNNYTANPINNSSGTGTRPNRGGGDEMSQNTDQKLRDYITAGGGRNPAASGNINDRYNADQEDNYSDPDVKAALKNRAKYEVPPELQETYNQIQSQINGDQDSYLKTRQEISRRKESQGLSNAYRNASSGADAQIGAGQVVQQYGQDSNEDIAADLQQKMGLRSQGLQAAGAMADEHNNQFIYNQQYPLEQRLEFLKQRKQNDANFHIAGAASGSQATSGILGLFGNIASAAIPLLK